MQLRTTVLLPLLMLFSRIANANQVQVVSVGRNLGTGATALKYYPDSIKAPVGSYVQFQFLAGNHTATQSSFDQPCIPISLTTTNVTGFFSGGSEVARGLNTGDFPVFTIHITNHKPIWVYCSTANHCQGGMGMVINEDLAANSTRSLENYKLMAANFQGPSPPPPLGLADSASDSPPGSPLSSAPTSISTSVSFIPFPTIYPSSSSSYSYGVPFASTSANITTPSEGSIPAAAAGLSVSCGLLFGATVAVLLLV